MARKKDTQPADRLRRQFLQGAGLAGLAGAGMAAFSGAANADTPPSAAAPVGSTAPTANVAAAKRGVYLSMPLRQDTISVAALQSRVRSVDIRNLAATMQVNLDYVLRLIDLAQGSPEEWGGEQRWGGHQDLICLHSQIYSRGMLGFEEFTEAERVKWAPVRQRLVRRHPGSGRLSLYLASHAGGIEGWPMPEARAFLRDLTEHATQRPFVYAHVWRPFDLVMWDNRATMHRARRFNSTEVRDMRRTTLTNIVSSLAQAP